VRWLARRIGTVRLSHLGRRLRALPVASGVIDRIDRRRSERVERRADVAEVARSRWRGAGPALDLTWGARVSGDAFVERALAHGAFAADGTVLEVGPGYGRILRSCVDRGVPFARYIGLDLSPSNVAHLRQEFADPRIEFIEGDVERTSLPGPVDTVISSLTFKHLYPSFQAALANVRRQLSDRGRVVFDLIEGHRRYFHWDGRTYVREYRRDEVARILAACSLEPAAFDTVEHDRDHRRLLVVARVSGRPSDVST
jgi:SAM-dependent methyltransferase